MINNSVENILCITVRSNLISIEGVLDCFCQYQKEFNNIESKLTREKKGN